MHDKTIYFERKPRAGEKGRVKRIELNGTDGDWVDVTVMYVGERTESEYNSVLRDHQDVQIGIVRLDYEGRSLERPAMWPGLNEW